MKNFKLSLAAILAVSSVSIVSADSLEEALTNGKASGDISITTEGRKPKDEVGTYYQNTGYVEGSVGLGYKTASFYNFSADVAFRGYKTLWEDDDDSKTGNGTGDASERFYQDGKNKTVDVERAYIAYDNGMVNIKAGRQYIATDWLTKTFDGVRAQMNFNDNTTSVDAIWVNRRGRIYARDYRPMIKTNGDNGGVYQLGITQKIGEEFKGKLYYQTAKDSHDLYGAKLYADLKSDDMTYGGLVHYMKTNEDVLKDDGDMIELKAYFGINGYTTTLGYVKTDKKVGWGSAAKNGDSVVPFEEGDGMYAADAQTFYLMVSKAWGPVSATLLGGQMDYGKYTSREFDAWIGYAFNDKLSLSTGWTYVDEDSDNKATTDLTQINATLTYKF